MLQTLFTLYIKNVRIMYMISPFTLFRLSLLYYAFSWHNCLNARVFTVKSARQGTWDVYFIYFLKIFAKVAACEVHSKRLNTCLQVN